MKYIRLFVYNWVLVVITHYLDLDIIWDQVNQLGIDWLDFFLWPIAISIFVGMVEHFRQQMKISHILYVQFAFLMSFAALVGLAIASIRFF